MMLPSKEKGKMLLICNLCINIEPINEDLLNSYKISKEIYYPPGDEYKNLEKMENWEERIYIKFI
jgi:hypothetical protein